MLSLLYNPREYTPIQCTKC